MKITANQVLVQTIANTEANVYDDIFPWSKRGVTEEFQIVLFLLLHCHTCFNNRTGFNDGKGSISFTSTIDLFQCYGHKMLGRCYRNAKCITMHVQR